MCHDHHIAFTGRDRGFDEDDPRVYQMDNFQGVGNCLKLDSLYKSAVEKILDIMVMGGGEGWKKVDDMNKKGMELEEQMQKRSRISRFDN